MSRYRTGVNSRFVTPKDKAIAKPLAKLLSYLVKRVASEEFEIHGKLCIANKNSLAGVIKNY